MAIKQGRVRSNFQKKSQGHIFCRIKSYTIFNVFLRQLSQNGGKSFSSALEQLNFYVKLHSTRAVLEK